MSKQGQQGCFNVCGGACAAVNHSPCRSAEPTLRKEDDTEVRSRPTAWRTLPRRDSPPGTLALPGSMLPRDAGCAQVTAGFTTWAASPSKSSWRVRREDRQATSCLATVRLHALSCASPRRRARSVTRYVCAVVTRARNNGLREGTRMVSGKLQRHLSWLWLCPQPSPSHSASVVGPAVRPSISLRRFSCSLPSDRAKRHWSRDSGAAPGGGAAA